jgi:hypothetical protein
MKHPLLLSDKKQREEVVRQYFCLFWRKASGEPDTSHPEGSPEARLVEKEILKELSSHFAKELGSPLIPVLSIRTLETLVARLFSRAAYRLRTERIQKTTDVVKKIKDSFDAWLVEIVRELVPEINPEGSF